MKKKSRKTIKHHGFTIRWRAARSRYEADRYLDPRRRIQQYFPTLDSAKIFAEQKNIELTNKGHDALNLSDRQRLDAVEALKILADKASLIQAAQYFIKHEHPVGPVVTVLELVRQYEDAMIARKAREHSIKGFHWRTQAFCRVYGNEPITNITRIHIESWLDNNGWQELNRRHYIAVIRSLFNYAIKQELLDVNPAAKIELPAFESKEPVILTPDQIQTMLHAAEEKEPAIVPALAISFFAGLRPVELARLDWSAIHLEGTEPVIHVGAEIAKKRHRRNVDILPNLTSWLTAYRKPQGKVMLTLSNYRRHVRRLTKETGTELPYNAGRHAFASYAYQIHGLDKTARWLGHGDGELLLTTYKGLVTKSAAEIFWSIKPKEIGKDEHNPVQTSGHE